MPVSKVRAFLSKHYHKLMQIRDTPHAVAGGFSIGVLIGFTPLLGFKTLVGLLLAWLFRCSKLAAAIGVTVHDILWLIWPLILRWQYKIGYWILHHEMPPKISRHHIRVEDWLHWKTLEILWPTFIGSLVLALPLTLLCYFVTLKLFTRYQSQLKELTAHESNVKT